MNIPIWKPSNQKRENSLLKDFAKFVNFKNSDSFKDLWKWSVDNPEIFWSKFWDYSKIIGDKGNDIILKDRVFNKTKFFPNSKLNYSENILKKKSDLDAIGFLSENGHEENISWNELYNKVCKFFCLFKNFKFR